MKKIYLFVADAETQTDDLNSIYGSQPIIPESPEMNESNVFKHVQNEAEVKRKLSTEDVINEKKIEGLSTPVFEEAEFYKGKF